MASSAPGTAVRNPPAPPPPAWPFPPPPPPPATTRYSKLSKAAGFPTEAAVIVKVPDDVN